MDLEAIYDPATDTISDPRPREPQDCATLAVTPGEAPSSVRWSTYEVLTGDGAQALLSLTAAHPGARVVHDGAPEGR